MAAAYTSEINTRRKLTLLSRSGEGGKADAVNSDKGDRRTSFREISVRMMKLRACEARGASTQRSLYSTDF